MQWDYLIVGAGAAGCVLAKRLSSRGKRVLLLEAGRDIAPDAVPADIEDVYPRSYFNPAYMWSGLKARLGAAGTNGSRVDFTQARVMGGGSNVMGMVALRGVPEDYDDWAAAGARGWGWSEVLPYFKRIERDCDFSGEMHGDQGPIQIRRERRAAWPPFCQAVGVALAARGFGFVADMNAQFGDGYGAVPMSITETRRVSSASAYLDTVTRRRVNLGIECETTAERLTFEGQRCSGVQADTRGVKRRFEANHVILSAGGIFSPALLLRSGIGPANDLARLGIGVVADAAGVGGNLQNHPVLYLATHLVKGARQSTALRRHFFSSLRYSSGIDAQLQSDMLLLVLNKSSWHGLGHSIAALGVSVYRPFSRGSVRLASPDPAVHPDIDFGFLTDERDTRRMIDGLRLALDVMRDPVVRAVRREIFVAGYSEAIRRLNIPGVLNRGAAALLARLMDGPDWLRQAVFRRAIAGGEPEEDAMTDPDWLARTVRTRTFAMFHPAGTCRMGAADEADAVLDPLCRVRGVRGLSVIDASAMPLLPRGNTNLPVVMLAEKAADHLLQEQAKA